MKAFAAMLALVLCAGWGWAEDAAKFAALEKQLSGTKFIGAFTIDGKEGAPAKEEYTILSVKKFGRVICFCSARG